MKAPTTACVDAWAVRYGHNPAWGGPEFGRLKIAHSRLADEFLPAWHRFLADNDPWLVQERHHPKHFICNLERWRGPAVADPLEQSVVEENRAARRRFEAQYAAARAAVETDPS